MTKAQSKTAKQRNRRENDVLCHVCGGTGRVVSKSAVAKATRGGNASFRTSLKPGQLTMAQRGQLGGRPKAQTLSDLDAVDRGANS